MSSPLSLTHHNRLDANSIEASDWLTLLSALPQARFYHHPDWFLTIDQHLLDLPMELSALSDEHGPVALFPGTFANQQRRFSAPVHDHLSLGDALLHPKLSPDALGGVVDTLLSESSPPLWDWQIGHAPARSVLARAWADQEAPRTQIRKARESAWFDLSDTLPPGGKLRRNLNRLRSKLSNEGELTVQWVTGKAELLEAYKHFLALESSGWKGKPGQSTAIADNPSLAGFYRQLLSPNYPGLEPVITLLWLDERCIAAQFGLKTGDCLSLLKIAYAEDYAAYSPGSLLLQDVITEAATRSVQTLSLVTSPPWASRWHPETEPVWHVTRYANNPGGVTLQTLDRLKQSARARLRPAA